MSCQQKLNDEQDKYVKVFQQLDQSGDGVLTIGELKRGLKALTGQDVSDADCVEMFRGVDKDGDHQITLDEFVYEMTRPSRKDAFAKLFHDADKDGNGVLSVDEVFRLCRMVGSFTDEQVMCMIQKVDKNGDGLIDLKEFLAIV